MQNKSDKLVYKIISAEVWSRADGQVVPSMPIDKADGYIHLSTAAQLSETLALHFKGQNATAILAVRTSDIEASLRWEPSRGGQLFPHVYGQIAMSAVASTAIIDVAADGTCDLTGLL